MKQNDSYRSWLSIKPRCLLKKIFLVGMAFFLLCPTECSAIEPGRYPSRADKSKASDSENELFSLLKSKSAGLWIEAPDRIRIWSKDQDVPVKAAWKFRTRAEISKFFDCVPHRKFLFAQISTVNMWSNLEKSASLVKEIEPFLDKLGYERILIFGCTSHPGRQTYSHPQNGTGEFDFFVFKDKQYSKSGDKNDNTDASRLDKMFFEKEMVMPFDSTRWKVKPHPPRQIPCNERTFMLPNLVRKYKLIGMTLPVVSKFLGEPCAVGEAKSNAAYELNFPTCGEVAQLFLQLEFRQGHVWRYRIKEIDRNAPGDGVSHSNWVNSNFKHRDRDSVS